MLDFEGDQVFLLDDARGSYDAPYTGVTSTTEIFG
jgi:hypothetical protein